jgi:enterochelin esterase-like enzyme
MDCRPPPLLSAGRGKVSDKLVLESHVYPGMTANVWYWTPAQYDGSTPLPVQIWGDGQFYVEHPADYHVFEALDNLIAQRKIPPIGQRLHPARHGR